MQGEERVDEENYITGLGLYFCISGSGASAVVVESEGMGYKTFLPR